MRQTITAVALVLLIVLLAFGLGYEVGRGPQVTTTPMRVIAEEKLLEVNRAAGPEYSGMDAVNKALAEGWSLKNVYHRDTNAGNREVFHLVRH